MKWKCLLVLTFLLSSCKPQRNVEESEVTGTDQIRYKFCKETEFEHGVCVWCESDKATKTPPSFVPDALWPKKLEELKAKGNNICQSVKFTWQHDLSIDGPKREVLPASYNDFLKDCEDDRNSPTNCSSRLIGDCKITRVTVLKENSLLMWKAWMYRLTGECRTRSSSTFGPRKGSY